MGHKTLLKYIELKTGYNNDGPAWIARVRMSQSGRTVYFNGRQYGWPGDWDRRVESFAQFIARVGVLLFELHCSYGVAGWVAASSMEDVVVEGRSQ